MNCPLCKHNYSEECFEVRDRLFRIASEQFQILRCLKCGVLFLYPPPDSEAMGKYYPKGYWVEARSPCAPSRVSGLRERFTDIYRRMVLRDHVRFVGRIIRDQHAHRTRVNLLDVGCGDGSFLESCGITDCAGLDASEHAVCAVRSRGIHAIQGSLTNNPFEEKSFSIITMFHFLEHVAEPDIYLQAAKQLLTEEGDLVIQVPNADSYQARLLKKRWTGYDAPRHLINYSAKTLCNTLTRNGFEIIRLSCFSLRDNAPMVAMSLFPDLYPPARAARNVDHAESQTWIKDLAFLGVTLAALPFTFAESLIGKGAAVMVHAKPFSS